MRQPKWTLDEVILAVNAYFEIGDVRKVTLDNPLVIELSKLLRALSIHKNTGAIFRNVTGVQMILKNIATLDKNAEYHLGAATKLQKKVYSYYFGNKLYLKELANVIRTCLPLPFDYYEPIDFDNFMAGNLLYLYHLYIENKSRAATILKEEFYNRRKSRCAPCGIDLSVLYGEKSYELLEQHYTEKIINYHNGMNILPDRFVAICPTCHKF
jgi:predicted HNH restriction endonuclease